MRILPGLHVFLFGTLVALSVHSARASGQEPVPPRDVKHSARVILLGTAGGPSDRALRSEPASLLVVDGHPYLIDAGAGVVQRIARAGFQPYQIDRVFITHHHLDHNAGLEALMSFAWIDRNMQKAKLQPPVEIYGPPATRFLVRSALNFLSVSERIFTAGGTTPLAAKPMFEAHRIDQDGVVYRDSRVCVVATENTHYHFPKDSAAYKAGDKSYAYRFNTMAGSVVFTGDTGPSEAVTHLADHADLLVSEVVNEAAIEQKIANLPPGSAAAAAHVRFHMFHEHLAPGEVGKMAARAHVKTVLLTHLVPGLDSEHNATEYTEGVSEHYDGPVIPGRDLFEYDLYGDETSPSCE